MEGSAADDDAVELGLSDGVSEADRRCMDLAGRIGAGTSAGASIGARDGGDGGDRFLAHAMT